MNESLPNIKGSLYNKPTNYQDIGLDDGVASGSIKIVLDDNNRLANQNISGYDNKILGWVLDASLSSSTYQDNAPVQQAATVVNFCIRY